MFTRFFPIPLALTLTLPGSAPLAAQNAAPAALAACDSDALCGRVPRPIGLYIRAVEEDGRFLALEDGSIWEVEISDRATTGSWAPEDFVNLSWIAAPRGDFEYLLTRVGTLEQKAAVRLAGRGAEAVSRDDTRDPALEDPGYPSPGDTVPEYPYPEEPSPEDPAPEGAGQE